MIIPKRDEIKKIQGYASEIEKQINSCLAEKVNYSEIIKILSSEKVQEILGKNQNIYILYIMSKVLEFELNQNVPRTVFDGRNTRDIIRLYRILTLYLRRLEFDFSKEYKMETIEYILSEKISMVAVMAIINNNNIIIHKERVISELQNILSEM